MSSHNEKPNDKTKSSETKQRGRWSRLMTIAFFSICVSMFGFAGFANAADYDASVTDATVNEADGTATFSVSVNPAVCCGDVVTIEVYTNDDTAEDETGDNDYIAVPKTDRVFTDGMTIIDVDVAINDDSKVEADELFKFLIGNVNNTGGSINVSDGEGIGTITNDDVELKVKVFHDPGVNAVFVDWGTGSQTCSLDSNCLNPNGLFLPVGTVVTLTPFANATSPYTWAFNEWKKDGSGDDNPYTITVNSSMQIDAHFKALGYRLTINATGSGTGCVTASEGSDWLMGGGTVCTFPAYFGYGDLDIVTLTPAADAGSVFDGWTGDGSGTPVRTVDMSAADRSVTVTFTNQVPTANDDSYTTSEETGLTEGVFTGVLINDTDPQGDMLEAHKVGDPSNGTLTLDLEGSFTYTPNVDFYGTDTFTYQAYDGTYYSNTATVTITVNNTNDNPDAVDDVAAVNEDSGANAIDVLANDTYLPDPAETLTITGVTQGSDGAVAITGGGTGLTYAPNVDFYGTDSFTYNIGDGNGGTDTATVNVTINAVNDAPSFNKGGDQVVDEDAGAQVVVGWATGMSVGPANEAGQVLTSFNVSNDNNPLFSDQPAIDVATGNLTYTPAPDANGVAVVSISLTDDGGTANGGNDTSPIQTFTITVNPVNDPPDAVDDAGAIDEDNVLNVAAAGVLSNDTDVDTGDTLSVTAYDATSVQGASVVVNADGSYTYDPTGAGALQALAQGATVVDTFTYTITDTQAGTDTATVSITVSGVNDAPDAVDDAGAIDEDNVLSVAAAGVLGNDSDVDDTFTITSYDAVSAQGAAVVVNADGSYTYDPTGAAALQALAQGATTNDTFTYTITDTQGGTDTATVTITVTGVNDALDAVDDAGATDEDTVLNVAASGVLSNDTDVDTADTLTVTAYDATSVQGASVVVNADGSYSYDPTGAAALQALAQGATVVDTFTYTASDGIATDIATVSITVSGVNDAPDAVDDAGAIDEDNVLSVLAASGVLSNDTDVDTGDTLSVSAYDAVSAQGAAVVVNADGSYTYDSTGVPALQALAQGATVVDTFTYTASDGIATDVATVSITVSGVNDAPDAVDDANATNEDTVLNVLAFSGVLINDTDVDTGAILSVTAYDATSAQGASVLMNADGSYTYDPTGAAALQALAQGATVLDTFTYDITDGLGGTDTATVSITVTGVNDAPDAVDDANATNEDSVLNVTALGNRLTSNDTDVDTGDSFTVTSFDAVSAQGAVVAVNADGTYNYDPTGAAALQALAQGATVVDTFTYTITDTQAGTDTATVSITVTGVNDALDAVDDANATDEDNVLTVVVGSGLLSNDTDVDTTDTLTVTAYDATSVQGAAVVVNADGSYTYDPTGAAALQALAQGATTNDTFTYTATDGIATDTATVSITVTGVNDAPDAVDDAGAIDEDTLLSVAAPGVLSNDTDVDTGDSFTVTSFDAVSVQGAAVAVKPDGSYTYDPTGVAAFQALAQGATAVDTFTYTITDTLGGTDTATVTVTVTGVNDAPSADFSAAPLVGVAPLTVDFTDLSTDMDDNIVGWEWDFDDDGTVDSTAQNPSVLFPDAGKYTVKLTVTDQAGGTDAETKSKYITVHLTIRITNPGTGTGTVDVSVVPSGMSSGAGQVVPAGGNLDLIVAKGDTVDVTNPQGAVGSVFIAASSDVPFNIPSATGSLITKTAVFELRRTITINNPGTGTGTVSVVSNTPSGLEVGGPYTIPAGGSLVLNVADDDDVVFSEVTPSADSLFISAGSDLSDSATTLISVDADETLTAIFQLKRTITITNPGSGSGTVNVADCSPSNAEPLGSRAIPAGGSLVLNVADGDTVTLNTLVADVGSILVAADTTLADPETFNILGSNVSRTATFQLGWTITITNPGSGTGTVNVADCSPSGLYSGSQAIPAGGDLVLTVADGDTVTLDTLAANAGSMLIAAGTTLTDPETFIIAGSHVSRTATIQLERDITISNPGTGTGTVNVVSCSPSAAVSGVQAIPAGGDLVLTVADGDTVTLDTLVANADSMLIAVNTTLTDPETFNILGSGVSRVAVFELIRTVTLTNPGLGSGTVTVDSCTPSAAESGAKAMAAGGSIVLTVAQNDQLTLSAVADVDSVFKGFDGDKMGGTPVLVMVNGDGTLTAEFRRTFTLTINWAGTGGGDVTASTGVLLGPPDDGGTSSGTSGSSISYIYEDGDTVDLTAAGAPAPAPGSIFKTWGGDLAGSNNPDSITMDADKAVTATFNQQWTLTIENPASGAGMVDASAGSISGVGGALDIALNPYSSFDIIYEHGDVVTVSNEREATLPDPGSRFKGYGGNPVTLDANKTVTATFVQLYWLTPVPVVNGTITPDTPQIVEHGDSLAFTAASDLPDYTVVDKVLVDGASVNGATAPPAPALNATTYTFTNVTANHDIGATFTDYGDDCSTAQPVCCPPDVSVLNAEISPAGDWDYVKIVTPTVGTLKAYTSGSTDTYGYLLGTSCDPNAPITRNDDKDQHNTNFYIEERNLLPGTYYVAVKHWERWPWLPTGTGSYTLHVEFNSDDHGSDPASATFVSCNSSISGNLETGGNEDYFAIDLSGDGAFTVYTTGTTDTLGALMDSSPAILTQDNNSGTGNNFSIQRNLPAGTYYVSVSHNDGVAGTGAYTLNVDCQLTHSIWATAGFGGSISPEGTIAVQEGQSQTFSITPDGSNTIYDVEVDGASVGAVSTYTFTNVTANHTIVAYFQLPPGICLDISDTPLDARFQAAPANVMFVLDDSGSMDWSFLTPGNQGQMYIGGTRYRYVFDDPGDNLYGNVLSRGWPRRHWKSQWYEYNRMFYNPNVTYEPWPTVSNAHGDFPRSHPWHASPTFNLSLSYQTVDTGAATDLTIVVDDEDPSPYFEKGPNVSQVIINDRDPAFSKTASNGGEWRSSTNSEAYNDEYYYSRRVGDYTATWTPNFPADGEYEVYARWADSNNRSTAVPYTITYSDGVGGTLTDTVTVDQRANGGKWVLLGTYFFSAGAGDVTLSYHVSSTSNDRVCADAIRFTPTGAAWDWATHGDAYNSHYWWTPTDGDYWAKWTPDLPVAGDWEVQVRWYGNNERSIGDAPDKVKYVITHAAGTTEYVPHPSQRKNSGVWYSLGTYTFNAGTGGNVTLTHTRTGSTETVCADAVRFIPPIPLTIDIKRAHYYTWDDGNANTVIDPGEVWLVVVDGSIKYYQFTDADSDDVVDTGELMPVTDLLLVPDSVKTGRTYLEERQNFANWYSFYRRRELTATAAVSKVIAQMKGVNIGYYSINGLLKQPVLPVKVGVNDQTPNLLNTLYSMVLKSAGTPLRRGLRSVGEYFDADDGKSGGLGNSPYVTAAEGGECQQAFAILMTDGYWNGGSPYLGNKDGDNDTDWDGTPYGDNYDNTLADVAMHYYERDLSSSLDDIVPVNAEDQATHQHMVTYSVAFGLQGNLNPDDYDFVNTFPTWPNVDGDNNETKIDDLYHAAKNGRGHYLSAKNPQELIDQMLAIIHNIESRIGSSSSVAVNGDELYETIGSDIRMFQGTYSSDGWTGDVKAYAIDLVSGEVLIETPLWSAAAQLEAQNWDSGRQIATFDGVTGRAFRFDSLTDELKDLLDVNWTTDDTNARNILNYVRGDSSNEQQNGGAFRNRFQRLGDIVHSSPAHVNGILYTGANDGMLHAFDATTGDELFAYVPKLVFENLKELKDPLYTHKYYVDLTPDVENVYALADADGLDNDLDGDTDEAGEMKLMTVLVGGLSKGGRGYYALDITGFDASTVFTEGTVAGRVMWEYPNPRVMKVSEGSCAGEEGPVDITTAVPHGLSVGDTVEITNVHNEANGTWTVKTVSSATQFRLNHNCDESEGSFYSGGNGTVSEIEPSWADMGFSYAKPAIVNSEAGWIVMFGNGYNSDTGIAKLIILDLLTGETVKIINTQADSCNGLSSPTPIDVDFDELVDYVYAGDLNGNLWKFDLTVPEDGEPGYVAGKQPHEYWDVAYKSAPYTNGVGTNPEPLFQARSPEGVPQPITAKPDVMDWCTFDGYMVTFGTGKWMGDFDFANTTTQTLYGIWDYGDDEDDSEYLGIFDRGATPQLSNQLPSVTLLQQTVLPCDPNIATCDGDFWVFYGQSLRVLTDNMASIVNPWGTTSEYNGGLDCGDGEGIIDCEPNNIGANPDPVKLAGWYFDLPLSGERSVSDALIREGRVIYVPYIPEDSPCGAGGDSVVMELNACTGGQTSKPQFDINEDGIIDENDFINVGTAEDPVLVAPSGLKAAGKLQPPAILRVPDTNKERKYFSSSRGKIVTVDEKAVTLGITYWQEFE